MIMDTTKPDEEDEDEAVAEEEHALPLECTSREREKESGEVVGAGIVKGNPCQVGDEEGQ